MFLETLAAVPGMVAAMTRHLHSLRRLQRDYGWIHTLLGIMMTLQTSYFYYFNLCYLLSAFMPSKAHKYLCRCIELLFGIFYQDTTRGVQI